MSGQAVKDAMADAAQAETLIARDLWPSELQRPEVVGVYVGICIDQKTPGIAWRRTAHAHTSPRDQYRGWICFRTMRGLADLGLVRHELAHILTGHGHDDVFRACLAGLCGGEVPRHERKVPRQASRWCRGKVYHGMCQGMTEPDRGGRTTFWYDDSGRVSHTTTTKARPVMKCLCWCHRER